MAALIPISEQTPSELMDVLRLEGQMRLGPRWNYFRKIMVGKEGFSLFKEADLVEKMKATRAALIFSSRNTRKNYRLVYRTVTSEIKRFTDIKEFPALPEGEGETSPSITPEMDSIILSWTPIKFLLPSKLIREKGRATQRHTEGVLAMLYFKLAAYYSVPEHWDRTKLTMYLNKITVESDFTAISSALKPLKDDLDKFCELYIPFRFGSPSRSKDIPSDPDAFEEIIKDPLEVQVSDLYWYNFIYHGIEQFLFQYYLTLIKAAPSYLAVRYLSQIFAPVIAKAIEIRHVFLGSMDTDRSKRPLKDAFEKYKKLKAEEPLTHEVRTTNKIFESYNYNLTLLEKNKLSYEVPESLPEDSQWGKFFDDLLTGISEREEKRFQESQNEEGTGELPEVNQELPIRDYSVLQIMAMVLKCGEFRVLAREKVLDRFKNIVKIDREIAAKRIKSIQLKEEKEGRVIKRKLIKMKAAKQTDMLALLEKDQEKLHQEATQRCKQIEADSRIHLMKQKKRAHILIDAIEKERHHHAWVSARTIFNVAQSVIPEPNYKNLFVNFIIDSITEKYEVELELFYKNIFNILEPEPREKMVIVQAIEKSGGENGIQLTLDEKDVEAHNAYLQSIKAKIQQMMPGVFQMKIMFGALKIMINELLSFSLENKSLQILLSLKVTAPNKPFFKLQGEIVRALLLLNSVSNPIPKHDLVLPDRANDKNLEKRINSSLLNKIVDSYAEKEKNN